MRKLEDALDRMAAAVSRIEAAADRLSGRDGGSAADELRAERDRLSAEVSALTERAEADARLRAEAAQAVRQALSDLRGAVGAEGARA